MKLIFEPKIYILAKTEFSQSALEVYLKDSNMSGVPEAEPSEQLVEASGRLCYLSFGKGRKTNAEYIENLLKQHHGSVLEHPSWSFLFTGISRSLSHELVRHRVGWAYSQLSQRYVDESQTAFVVPPIFLRKEAKAVLDFAAKQWEQSLLAYIHLVSVLEDEGMKRKQAREAARCVLPNATETQIVATANARAIRHFLEMRGSEGADAEIRRLAFKLLSIMKAEAPNIFGDYSISIKGEYTDTREHIKTDNIKV